MYCIDRREELVTDLFSVLVTVVQPSRMKKVFLGLMFTDDSAKEKLCEKISVA